MADYVHFLFGFSLVVGKILVSMLVVVYLYYQLITGNNSRIGFLQGLTQSSKHQ